MKKLMSVLTILFAMHTVQAQDFDKVKTILLLGKTDEAKTDYDKILAKKPNLVGTAAAHYWKSRIYSAYHKDAVKYPNAYNETKTALEAYINAEPSLQLAKDNGQEPFFDVYIRSFKGGVDSFNVKAWSGAAAHFVNAVKYSDIIFTQGWASSKQKFDTTAIIYAGYSSQNAGNLEQTIFYYKKLVDNKVATPELVDVYRYLLIQYIDKKDKAQFDTYLAMSIAAYPNESWVEFSTDYIDKNLSLDEKVDMFDKLVAVGSITELESQMFGDMFMSGKNAEGISQENIDKYISKASEAYKKAYTMNNKNFAAAFNAGISHYNSFSVLDEKVSVNLKALQAINASKPVAPKDPKKKAAFDAFYKAKLDSVRKINMGLEVPIKENVDAAIEWIDKAYNVIKDKEKLERSEKNVALRSVDFLATLYAYKRDKNRGKDQKAFDDFDAKFNIYDKLHDKYQ
jgi:tetratricopeptide (TPR) repeat protein